MAYTVRKEHTLKILRSQGYYLARKGLQWEVGNLHNEELNSFQFSPNVVRATKSVMSKRSGHGPRMGEDRSALKCNPTGKRLLGRPRHGWNRPYGN